MIKLNEIQLEHYLNKYIHTSYSDCLKNAEDDNKFFTHFYLNNNMIQKWKENENFEHLKKELKIYQNVEFGCTKHEYGCDYILFFNNKKASHRTTILLSELFHNNRILITKCTFNNYPTEARRFHVFGEYNNCKLF